MAVDNFSNLKQYIKRWSHREDVINDVANDCIALAEQEMFYGQTPFRLPEMITETIYATTTKTIAYPTNKLEIINVSIEVDGVYYRLKVVPPQQLPDVDGRTGVPCLYAMRDTLTFDVTPDKSYNVKVEYYEKPAALSDSNTSNIILQKYPLAYTNGGLAMAMQYAGEEDRMNEYVIRMRDIIAKANIDADNFLYGSMPTIFNVGSAP